MYEKRDAVRTGRAAARPARVALAHATGVLLAIVAVLSLVSAKAYALPGSERNGYPLGEILMSENVGANRGTAVYGAANEFFATLCLIGRKSDYLQLSSEQLSELSGEGTGGAFYELSQRWSNLASDGAPADWPIGIGLAIEGQGLVSDPAYIWYADYSYYETDSLYKRALDDYLTIYNGGHLGGGGGGDFDGYTLYKNPSSITFYPQAATRPDVCKYTISGTRYYLYPELMTGGLPSGSFAAPATLSFDASSQSDKAIIDGYINNGYDFIYVLQFNSNGYFLSMLILAKPESYQISTHERGWPVISFKSDYATGSVKTRGGSTDWYGYSITSSGSYSIGPLNSSYALSNCDGLKGTRIGMINGYTNNSAFGSGGGGGGGGGGGTWPEPEPTPEPDPPDVPEPQEPTGPGIDPPDPIGYTIDPTDDPDPVTDPYVVVVAPDSQDIIPWLRAILQAINNLGDKLNDESTELQRALNDVFFGNLSKLLKNLKGEFLQDFTQWLDLELEWMMESIESLFLDLQDYLHDLFEWLADQMNFEFDISTDPYDDTSLLNWLRRIYNKLGADGGPNTRPVDPSTDPEGFLDWLRRMIQEFILGLGASASDLVSDIGDLLSRLFAKFPFSVPWDILAILGMLDAPPVAPRIQFSIPVSLGADSFNWSVDIDMQVWSTYFEAVRTVILLSFITWLAWLTPQVLRDLDPGDFL